MVHIGKVYTKTGDSGSTSLVDGTRVPKDAARIEAYGTVDEVNAALGVVRDLVDGAFVTDDRTLLDAVTAIQNDLFDLGADLATPIADAHREGGTFSDDGALRIVASQVERLESEIDAMNEALPELSSFVLPGGCPSAAELHRARTVCRRAERCVVTLARDTAVNPAAVHYLNRLSDWLFVAARRECVRVSEELHWIPAANRG